MRISAPLNSNNAKPYGLNNLQTQNVMSASPQSKTALNTQDSISFKGLPQIIEQMPVATAKFQVKLAQLPIIRMFFNTSTRNLIKISQTPAATSEKMKNALASAASINRYRNVEILGEKLKEFTEILNMHNENASGTVPSTYLQFMLRDKKMQKYLKTLLADDQSNSTSLKRLANMFTGKNYTVEEFLKAMTDCQTEYQQKLKEAGIEGLDQLVKGTGIGDSAKVIIAPDMGSGLGNHIVARMNKKTVNIYNLVPEEHLRLAGESTPEGKGAFTLFSVNPKVKFHEIKLDSSPVAPTQAGVQIIKNMIHGIKPTTRAHYLPLKTMNIQDTALLNLDNRLSHVATEWQQNPAIKNASNLGDYTRQPEIEAEKAQKPGFFKQMFSPKPKQIKEDINMPQVDTDAALKFVKK